MRHLSLAVLLGLFVLSEPLAAQSSVSRGSYSVSGGFGYSSEKYEGDRKRAVNLTINPSVFYFVRDNLGLGLSMMYERSRTNDYEVEGKQWGADVVGFGPSFRYYLGGTEVLPFLLTGYYFARAKYKDQETKNTVHDLYLGAGIDVPLTDFLSIEASGLYHNLNAKNRVGYGADGSEILRPSESGSQIELQLGVSVFLY